MIIIHDGKQFRRFSPTRCRRDDHTRIPSANENVFAYASWLWGIRSRLIFNNRMKRMTFARRGHELILKHTTARALFHDHRERNHLNRYRASGVFLARKTRRVWRLGEVSGGQKPIFAKSVPWRQNLWSTPRNGKRELERRRTCRVLILRLSRQLRRDICVWKSFSLILDLSFNVIRLAVEPEKIFRTGIARYRETRLKITTARHRETTVDGVCLVRDQRRTRSDYPFFD